MLFLEDKHKKIIWDIIKKYPYTFYAFGSRTTGKNRRFSDLDIFLKESITTSDLLNLKEDLENSNLPFTIDIVESKYCKEEFTEIIKKDLIELNKNSLGIK